MFNKIIPIQFIAETKEFLEIAPKPTVASKNVPEWFKKMPSYVNNVKGIDQYGDPTSTVKKCMPVNDCINAGYNIVLPCDVWITNHGDDKLKIQWAWENIKIVTGQRPDQHEGYPIPEGYNTSVFKFINHWIVKTPKNWSCLLTHPLHHEELPFRTLSSVVDTDRYPSPIHFPFFLKKGFNGLIPQGTPIVQIIPFKREKFRSTYSWDKDGKLATIWKKAHNIFFDRYLKNFRSPKTYEEGDVKVSKCPFHW